MQKITTPRTRTFVYLPDVFRRLIAGLGLSQKADGLTYQKYIEQAVEERLQRDGLLEPEKVGRQEKEGATR